MHKVYRSIKTLIHYLFRKNVFHLWFLLIPIIGISLVVPNVQVQSSSTDLNVGYLSPFLETETDDGTLNSKVSQSKWQKTIIFNSLEITASNKTDDSMVSSGLDVPEQSRTGPKPPESVVARDMNRRQFQTENIQNQVMLDVPAYSWRHGCGPTAIGMVLGYYDGLGYEDLIPGNAEFQTPAVDQAIASGGDSNLPAPPGSEGNYEDYADPVDSYPVLLPDRYLSLGRVPHVSNSIADFMDTSKSSSGNYYGWSWSSDVGPAFTKFVNLKNTLYQPSYQQFNFYDDTLSWSVLTSEIDAGRPMVFLVDSSGDGGTDHFITIIGYRSEPTLQYASWDTWSTSNIRWENFSAINSGVPWGVWGGWALRLSALLTVNRDGTGGGTITSMPAGINCGLTCTAVFESGDVVTLEAVPNAVSRFTGWSGGCTNDSGPCILGMTQAMNVTATFETSKIYLPNIQNGGF